MSVMKGQIDSAYSAQSPGSIPAPATKKSKYPSHGPI